ncbi:hypothetical protein ROS1_28640 [Roseibium sp. ROS1]
MSIFNEVFAEVKAAKLAAGCSNTFATNEAADARKGTKLLLEAGFLVTKCAQVPAAPAALASESSTAAVDSFEQRLAAAGIDLAEVQAEQIAWDKKKAANLAAAAQQRPGVDESAVEAARATARSIRTAKYGKPADSAQKHRTYARAGMVSGDEAEQDAPAANSANHADAVAAARAAKAARAQGGQFGGSKPVVHQ